MIRSCCSFSLAKPLLSFPGFLLRPVLTKAQNIAIEVPDRDLFQVIFVLDDGAIDKLRAFCPQLVPGES